MIPDDQIRTIPNKVHYRAWSHEYCEEALHSERYFGGVNPRLSAPALTNNERGGLKLKRVVLLLNELVSGGYPHFRSPSTAIPTLFHVPRTAFVLLSLSWCLSHALFILSSKQLGASGAIYWIQQTLPLHS